MSKTVKGILWGLLAAVLVLLVYGVFIEPRYLLEVEEEVALVPGLPEQWEGKRIGVIADLQVGMWFDNERAVGEAVRRLVEQRPEVVLIAGDFIYFPGLDPTDEKIAESIALLQPLTQAGIPTYAVLGNHDYGLEMDDEPVEWEVARTVTDRLQALGIQVLRNEAVPLDAGPEPLYLVGVDSHWAELDRPLEALEQVPPGAPRIAFFHHPDSFPKFPAGTAPVAVAGHTHGGQVRLPFLPDWSWTTLAYEGEAHADGWIDGWGAPGNRLYINRGIGMSMVPVRINCPPEVTLFTLRRGEVPAPEQQRPAAARRGRGERR